MEIEKLEFREALQILAKEAGVELKTDIFKEKNSPSQELYDIHRKASDYYGLMLQSQEGVYAREYLKKRGISEDIQRAFQLGYCPGNKELFEKLLAQDYSRERLNDSGIFIGESREKFAQRLVFPFFNFSGNPVGFTARTLENQEPKYLNSPTTSIFNKSAILYGLSLAKKTISKEDKIIIVEGQMDTISLHQHGISTAVGISGTALTLEHVQFIKRLTKNIYLCLDGDSAGIKATFSSMEALENQEVNTKIIQLPNGKDPDEYLQSGGIWAEAESKALSPIAYTLQQLTHQFDITTVTGKTAAAKHLMEKVSRIQNRIEADVYIREIAQLLQLTPEILYAEYKQQKFPTRATIKKNETKKRELCEDIIGYLAAYGDFSGFFTHFPYSIDGWDEIPSFSVLREILNNSESWQQLPQADEFLSHALYIESQHDGASIDSIQQTFVSHILALKKACFKLKKQHLLAQLSPSAPEYLSALQACLKEERELGLK